jgi:hypothetical protein
MGNWEMIALPDQDQNMELHPERGCDWKRPQAARELGGRSRIV